MQAHCEEMDRGKVLQALRIMIDTRNHPVLLHCRSGKHRTGALTGCLRMVRTGGCGQQRRCICSCAFKLPHAPAAARHTFCCPCAATANAFMQLQHWDMERACDEYVRYCRHKQRSVDKAYIERFDPRTLQPFLPAVEHKPTWLPASATELPSKLEQTTGAAPPPIDIPAALAAHAAKEAAAAAALAAATAGATSLAAGSGSPRPAAADVAPLRGRACSASPGGDDTSAPTSPALICAHVAATSPAAGAVPATAAAPSSTASAPATLPAVAVATSSPIATGTPVAASVGGGVGVGGGASASSRPTILRGTTGKSIFDAPGAAAPTSASSAAAAASC